MFAWHFPFDYSVAMAEFGKRIWPAILLVSAFFLIVFLRWPDALLHPQFLG